MEREIEAKEILAKETKLKKTLNEHNQYKYKDIKFLASGGMAHIFKA